MLGFEVSCGTVTLLQVHPGLPLSILCFLVVAPWRQYNIFLRFKKELIAQSIGSVVNRRPGQMHSDWHLLCVKPVVVVGKANLGHVQRAFRAPLADVDPHVDSSHDSFDSAGRLPVQSLFQCCEHVATGVLQI